MRLTWQATVFDGINSSTLDSYADLLGFLRERFGKGGYTYLSYQVNEAVSPVFRIDNQSLYIEGVRQGADSFLPFPSGVRYAEQDCSIEARLIIESTKKAQEWAVKGKPFTKIDAMPICFWLAEAARFELIETCCQAVARGKNVANRDLRFRRYSSAIHAWAQMGRKAPIPTAEIMSQCPELTETARALAKI